MSSTNSASIFLNTRVEDNSLVPRLGDACLSPLRYLFQGKTIKIVKDKTAIKEVFAVKSFSRDLTPEHKEFDIQRRISPPSSKNIIKTISAIVFLIPGLILGSVIKGLSYLSSTIRENHRAIKMHNTPLDIEIGKNKPAEKDELENEIQKAQNGNTYNRPINAVIIQVNGESIDLPNDLLKLKPKRVILVGAATLSEISNPIINKLLKIDLKRRNQMKSSVSMKKSRVIVEVNTVKDALNQKVVRKVVGCEGVFHAMRW